MSSKNGVLCMRVGHIEKRKKRYRMISVPALNFLDRNKGVYWPKWSRIWSGKSVTALILMPRARMESNSGRFQELRVSKLCQFHHNCNFAFIDIGPMQSEHKHVLLLTAYYKFYFIFIIFIFLTRCEFVRSLKYLKSNMSEEYKCGKNGPTPTSPGQQ